MRSFAVYLCLFGLILHAGVLAQTFLTRSGANLVYGSTNVVLKGTNFDNVGALGASIGSGNPSDVKFSDFDYSELARAGANHARFGLSFNWWTDYKTVFYQKLDEQIGYAKKYNLWIILNLFTTPGNCYEGYGNTCGLWTSSSEQTALKNFWVDVATRYKNEPVIAGYDILNEPTPGGSCSTWFTLAKTLRDAIVAVAPNQLIFVETCSDPLNDLMGGNPPTSANVVWEVHDYFPMDMTHDFFNPGSVYPGQATEWFGTCYIDKSVLISGTNCPNANIRETYGINYAKNQNMPIYVGEWGATSTLNGYALFHQDRAELYRDWGLNHAHYTWKHQTIKTGGFYQWGIYSDQSTLDDLPKYNAVKIAFAGAVLPNFTPTTTAATTTASATTTVKPPTTSTVSTTTPSATTSSPSATTTTTTSSTTIPVSTTPTSSTTISATTDSSTASTSTTITTAPISSTPTDSSSTTPGATSTSPVATDPSSSSPPATTSNAPTTPSATSSKPSSSTSTPAPSGNSISSSKILLFIVLGGVILLIIVLAAIVLFFVLKRATAPSISSRAHHGYDMNELYSR